MLPVQRKTRSQTRKGRSHHALQARKATRCPNCGGAKLPHAACNDCGFVRTGLKLESTRED